jgi:sulfatase modifying factor 1
MNNLKTIVVIFMALIISLMASCTSSNSQLPSKTATSVMKSPATASSATSTQAVSTTTATFVTSTQTVSSTTTKLIQSNLALIPGGEFEMGDHIGVIDPKHPTDEIPIHKVTISRFFMGKVDITVSEYCDFLNSALARGQIVVSSGLVYLSAGKDALFQTREADQYSRISWDGCRFGIPENRGNHPVTSVLWHGAAAYCNWLSTKDGYQPCYNTSTWDCDFSKNGYRLPTEAEWEYAARGGQYSPYYNYPWGNEADKSKANWPGSGDPYETGPLPWTTPVGFYNGKLQIKSDFGWPGSQASYQTSNGANGYGLFDMAGNVWQWCNDWYGRDYYKISPAKDPTGPTIAEASPMPDGKPYRVLRGGNWFNGEADTLAPEVDNGHSRVSNRDPAYYRGPQDPNHPYYHVGFRVVRRD